MSVGTFLARHIIPAITASTPGTIHSNPTKKKPTTPATSVKIPNTLALRLINTAKTIKAIPSTKAIIEKITVKPPA